MNAKEGRKRDQTEEYRTNSSKRKLQTAPILLSLKKRERNEESEFKAQVSIFVFSKVR
jgi:hypothetical protein